MIHPEVTTLYKYSGVSDRSLEAVRTSAFWFARPSTFNDPFDCSISVAEDALQESVEHALHRIAQTASIPPNRWLADEQDEKAYAEFRASLRGLFSDAGVLCLAEPRDNLLMWAHYGASHGGFCIGFRRAPGTMFAKIARPVAYQDAYPRLTLADFDQARNPRSADHIWLTKGSVWSYEREWRLLMHPGDRLYQIDAPITEVIFGARMLDEDRAAVIDATVAGGHCPHFFQAIPSSSEFALEITHWES
jgi:hypothetical protein